MHIQVKPNSGVPLYQQIGSQIKYLIAAGRLVAGEKLPPVRRLAEQLVVNPNTVARAYRELESERVVTSRQGSGVFVSDAGSPLARSEQTRILNEQIDALLIQAHQLNFDTDALVLMLHNRAQRLRDDMQGNSKVQSSKDNA